MFFVCPSITLRLSEKFSITPVSNEILFYPDTLNVSIEENCPGAIVQFEGKEGKFIEGAVLPALQAVSINIITKANPRHPSKTIEIFTNEEGKYRSVLRLFSFY